MGMSSCGVSPGRHYHGIKRRGLPRQEACMVPFETRQVFIGGQWRDAGNSRTLDLTNPSDGSLLANIARGDAEDIDAAVAAARASLDGAWGRMTATERGRILAEMGRRVLAEADQLARLEAMDVGKPLKQGRADAVALARYLE